MVTIETRARMSAAHIGKKHSIETKAKISAATIGHKYGLTHNMSYTPTYESWHSMLQRTSNSNNKRYADYGGRGITVCERWQSFANFFEDMGDRPGKKGEYSIDRIDNDGNYEPGNCRWATRSEQQRNKRPKS